MNFRKLIYTIPVAALAFAFAACDGIAEDDRFIYVEPADVKRAVLLEDFTGQMCPNCPTAAEEIERIIKEYGDTAVIAVGIHSGPTGFAGNKNAVGLMTDTGNEYFIHWGLSTQPVGIINRSTGPIEYTNWATGIYNEISKQATLSMEISNSYKVDSRQLDISVLSSGLVGTITGKLQVWMVEDGITAVQVMPNGDENSNYVHNHVFRAAVNGTWGEDITIAEGEVVTRTFEYNIPADWKPENVSVVAFVYNDVGVQQVTKAAIMSDEKE